MAVREYTAEVKNGLLLELPAEAVELQLRPGDRVTVKLSHTEADSATGTPAVRERPSALGKYAFVAGGSEQFARDKQEEIAREDRSR